MRHLWACLLIKSLVVKQDKLINIFVNNAHEVRSSSTDCLLRLVIVNLRGDALDFHLLKQL